MFIGHYAVALAAKRAVPKTSLGTLTLAAQWLDLLWPILLLLGMEHVAISPGNTRVTPLDFYDYPISHSLMTVLLWAAGFGAAFFAVRRNTRAAVVCAALVASHWFLDLLVHRPDLPLTPAASSSKVGLGLWNTPALSAIVELTLYAVGVWLYLKTTWARDAVGRWALWSLLALLLLIGVGAYSATPPPSVRFLAWQALGQWLFVAWAYWIDRHRELRA